MTKPFTPELKAIPLNIVGSSIYGRYPKISSEKTTNMIISDDFLVPYAGYKKVIEISDNLEGRGLFSSARWGKMIAVISEGVYAISNNLSYVQIGTLVTTAGDVFIDENNKYEICICDKVKLYIYNWSTMTFTTLSLDFQPGYIVYQDSRFIAPNINTASNEATWRLSDISDSESWPNDAQHVGSIQTKADYAIASLRVPSGGNALFIFGKTVTEIWFDVGNPIFPYQKSSSMYLDFGLLNAATLASIGDIAMWAGINEKAGPAIFIFTKDKGIQQISTDGINFRLAHLDNPQNCYGFFFKQDGHLLYQLTFPDSDDNWSLVYDVTTGKFFDLTNENGDAHIAKRVVFFNNRYYFISIIDGNIYELSSLYSTYDYITSEYSIPRSRICKSIRFNDQANFNVNSVSFTTEQGEDPNAVLSTEATYSPHISLSISRDGGYTYGSKVHMPMYRQGNRKNRLIWWRCGMANDFTPQFDFWSDSRFVVTDGVVNVAA